MIYNFKTKKGISPVVAVILLLVIAITAFVNFQNWFGEFSSSTYSDVEIRTNDELKNSLSIELLEADILYVKNNLEDNLSLNEIKVGNKKCNITKNLSLGISEINLGKCLENVSGQVQDITIITKTKIITKRFFISHLSGGGNAVCSLIDADSDGLLDFLDNDDSTPNNICTTDNLGFCFLNNTNKTSLDIDLKSENIKSGVEIFGINGTYKNDINNKIKYIIPYVNTNADTILRFATNNFLLSRIERIYLKEGQKYFAFSPEENTLAIVSGSCVQADDIQLGLLDLKNLYINESYESNNRNYDYYSLDCNPVGIIYFKDYFYISREHGSSLELYKIADHVSVGSTNRGSLSNYMSINNPGDEVRIFGNDREMLILNYDSTEGVFVHKSTDGNSWNKYVISLDGNVLRDGIYNDILRYNDLTDTWIFALSNNSNTKIYNSNDGGETWNHINTISNTKEIFLSQIDECFYLSVDDINVNGANYKSCDDGQTWTNLNCDRIFSNMIKGDDLFYVFNRNQLYSFTDWSNCQENNFRTEDLQDRMITIN